jgi:hypothetical protein
MPGLQTISRTLLFLGLAAGLWLAERQGQDLAPLKESAQDTLSANQVHRLSGLRDAAPEFRRRVIRTVSDMIDLQGARGLVRPPRIYPSIGYTISNPKPYPIVAPVLTTGYDWSSMQGLLAEVRRPTELETAKAIWMFLCVYRKHRDYTGLPVSETSDPVKHFAIYDGGICSDAAQVFCRLCMDSGMPARLVYLRDHTVAEVYAGGAWRLFDPDLQSYYTEPGTDSPVSLARILQQPEVLRSAVIGPGQEPWMTAKPHFSTGPDHPKHYTVQPNPGPVALLRQTLPPGASLQVGNGWEGLYPLRGFLPPPSAGVFNGLLVTPIRGHGVVTSCFPIVGIRVYLSSPAVVTVQAGSRRARGTGPGVVDLSSLFVTSAAAPDYAYSIQTYPPSPAVAESVLYYSRTVLCTPGALVRYAGGDTTSAIVLMQP